MWEHDSKIILGFYPPTLPGKYTGKRRLGWNLGYLVAWEKRPKSRRHDTIISKKAEIFFVLLDVFLVQLRHDISQENKLTFFSTSYSHSLGESHSQER